MFFVVAVDMLWQPVPYKFLQVCGGQCGQGRRRHDPWWHQSYGEAGRLPRVPAKRRSSVETDGDLGVSWENLGKWWENDGKMMMYGTSWPNWRSRSSVSRLAYGRTVWSRCFFFSGILTLQFFKMGFSGVSAKVYGTTMNDSWGETVEVRRPTWLLQEATRQELPLDWVERNLLHHPTMVLPQRGNSMRALAMDEPKKILQEKSPWNIVYMYVLYKCKYKYINII